MCDDKGPENVVIWKSQGYVFGGFVHVFHSLSLSYAHTAHTERERERERSVCVRERGEKWRYWGEFMRSVRSIPYVVFTSQPPVMPFYVATHTMWQGC